MGTLTEAFRQAGVKAINPRWSWSACNINDRVVAVTLWEDRIDRLEDQRLAYNTFDHGNLPAWINKQGNRERLGLLKWTQKNCDGKFRAIMLTARNRKAEPRRMASARYEKDMIFKLVRLCERTGDFSAEQVVS